MDKIAMEIFCVLVKRLYPAYYGLESGVCGQVPLLKYCT